MGRTTRSSSDLRCSPRRIGSSCHELSIGGACMRNVLRLPTAAHHPEAKNEQHLQRLASSPVEFVGAARHGQVRLECHSGASGHGVVGGKRCTWRRRARSWRRGGARSVRRVATCSASRLGAGREATSNVMPTQAMALQRYQLQAPSFANQVSLLVECLVYLANGESNRRARSYESWTSAGGHPAEPYPCPFPLCVI